MDRLYHIPRITPVTGFFYAGDGGRHHAHQYRGVHHATRQAL